MPLPEAEFTALRYVWGTGLIPHRIQIDGKPFCITWNLYQTLHTLRNQRSDRALCIDAMCINQKDDAEKDRQVQMMQDIYAKASKAVFFWLGEHEKGTESVLNLMR